jgi:hypothetical protein
MSKAKSRSPRRKPSELQHLERVAQCSVDDALESFEHFHLLIMDADVSLERAFLAASSAHYARAAKSLDAPEDQEVHRFLAGGEVGYRIGLEVGRRLGGVR